VLSDVKSLQKHADFNPKNPNRARALLGVFGRNLGGFHVESASGGYPGYEFLASQVVEIDKVNPQTAARLLTPFALWRKLDERRQQDIQTGLLWMCVRCVCLFLFPLLPLFHSSF
jgi:aminopeptidase N